jgi:hypothetical protein
MTQSWQLIAQKGPTMQQVKPQPKVPMPRPIQLKPLEGFVINLLYPALFFLPFLSFPSLTFSLLRQASY